MADRGSYISRFLVKLLEISAAALATAVSGYVVAHFSGYLPFKFLTSAPQPAAVQVAPRDTGGASRGFASSPANSPWGTTSAPVTIAIPTAPATPTAPAATEASEPPPAATQDAAGQPARKSTAAKSPPAHKRDKAEKDKAEKIERAEKTDRVERTDKADKAETGATAARPRDNADESVEAQVRAALSKVDANRPPPTEAPRTVVVPPAAISTPPVVSAPPPAVEPSMTATAPPRAIEPAPTPVNATPSPPPRSTEPPPLPVQPVPGQTGPLTTVEIKSRPIATVDDPASPAPAPEEKGLFAAIKHIIPDLRRPNMPAPSGETPRPPAPVGE